VAAGRNEEGISGICRTEEGEAIWFGWIRVGLLGPLESVMRQEWKNYSHFFFLLYGYRIDR
jgi:hypothetical protein